MGAVIRSKILTTSFRCDGTAKAKANDSQQRRQQAASKQNVYASQHKLNKSSSCRCGLGAGRIGGKETGRIWKGYVHNCCAKLCKKKENSSLRSTQQKHLRRAEYLSLSLYFCLVFECTKYYVMFSHLEVITLLFIFIFLTERKYIV